MVLLLPMRQQNSIGFPPTFPEEVGKNFESMAKVCDTGQLVLASFLVRD